MHRNITLNVSLRLLYANLQILGGLITVTFVKKGLQTNFSAQRKKIASNSKSYKLSQHQVHVIRNTELDQALIFL